MFLRDSTSSARNEEREPPVVIRRGNYTPAAPEALSPAGRWVVKIEIAAAVLLVAGLTMRYVHQHRPDTRPIRIASIAMPTPVLPNLPGGGSGDASADAGSADKGHVLFMQTCTSCHGQNAQGLPHMGISLRESKFVAGLNDRKLVAFLKQGRKPTDPKNSTGLLMPPRGGNPSLDDDALGDIVAFLRLVQKEHQAEQAQQQQPGTPTAEASPTTRPVAAIDPSAR